MDFGTSPWHQPQEPGMWQRRAEIRGFKFIDWQISLKMQKAFVSLPRKNKATNRWMQPQPQRCQKHCTISPLSTRWTDGSSRCDSEPNTFAFDGNMKVSWNRGTPKSSILFINHPFWGTSLVWKPPYGRIIWYHSIHRTKLRAGPAVLQLSSEDQSPDSCAS